MRFKCGKDYNKLQQWHRWFAWHPVRLNGECVWLETVERRMTGMFYLDIEFEYREANESSNHY